MNIKVENYQGSSRKDSQKRLSQPKGLGRFMPKKGWYTKGSHNKAMCPKETRSVIHERRSGNKRKGRGSINALEGGETMRHR